LGVAEYAPTEGTALVTRHLEGIPRMSKKKRAEIGKMVDDQAKGKKVTGARTDKKTPEGKDLDVRTSKTIYIKYG
jgi:hypothetical protein